jgi:hypothetical protein
MIWAEKNKKGLERAQKRIREERENENTSTE